MQLTERGCWNFYQERKRFSQGGVEDAVEIRAKWTFHLWKRAAYAIVYSNNSWKMLNNLEQHAVELFLLNEVYKHNDAMTCTEASSQTDRRQ